MPSKDDSLKELESFLERDSRSQYRKYPAEAFYAIKDERVVKALSSRFRKDIALINIKPLRVKSSSGITELCFEFSGDKLIRLSTDLVLVILNNSNQVIEVIDPFELPQGELGNFQTPADLPFVLHMPSLSQNVIYSSEDLRDAELRTKQYLGEDLQSAAYTGTGTPLTVQTCLEYTGSGARKRCDEWRTSYLSDAKADDPPMHQP